MTKVAIFSTALVVGLSLIIYFLASFGYNYSCKAKYGGVGKTEYRMFIGCMVEYEGRWWPAESVRVGQ